MLTALADGQLLAEKTGSTPPRVVALHGWGRTGTDFSAIVAGLDALAIHLPGFGITPEPPTAWGSEDYADHVAAALSGFGPVVVAGHSFGGRVAVRLAAKYPARVSGLVLTGVPLLRLGAAPRTAVGFRVARALARAGIVSQRRLERLRRRYGSVDYLAVQGVMRDTLVRVIGEKYGADLAKLACPVRMVWGELDTAAPADAGRAASELVTGARFRQIPGARHLLEGELAIAVREELLALVSEVAS